MTTSLGKRSSTNGISDIAYKDEKAPVYTSTDQFVQGTKTFSSAAKFLGNVLCSGSYYGDGSHLTNVTVPNLQAVLNAGNSARDTAIRLDQESSNVYTLVNANLLEMNDGGTINSSLTSSLLTLDGDGSTLTATKERLSVSDGSNSVTLRPVVIEMINSQLTNPYTQIEGGYAILSNTSNSNRVELIADLNPRIELGIGPALNTITSAGYTTKNTTANATHYLNFSDSFSSGIGAIQKVNLLNCNPSTGNITATTFTGNLVGRADSAATINTTSSSLATACYPTFTNTSAGLSRTLHVDDSSAPILTYIPSTGVLSANAYTILGTPATAGVASKFGQVGLVLLQTLTGTITGASAPVNFNLPNIFNATYSRYKISITPTAQVAFTAYPAYSLAAFLGTGAPPTQANQYGTDVTSTGPVTPYYNRGVTISASPLSFTGFALINRVVEFKINNVGMAYTQSGLVELTCSSCHENPGIRGACLRTLTAEAFNGTTITGLTLTQSNISVGNSFGWTAKIYGYNAL